MVLRLGSEPPPPPQFNHCGEVLVTAPHMWKCSTTCEDGWEQPGFDDSAWPVSTDAGINGVDPWGIREVSPVRSRPPPPARARPRAPSRAEHPPN